MLITLVGDPEFLGLLKDRMFYGDKTGILVAREKDGTSSISINFNGTVLVESYENSISGIYELQKQNEEDTEPSLKKTYEYPKRRSRINTTAMEAKSIGNDIEIALSHPDFHFVNETMIIKELEKIKPYN